MTALALSVAALPAALAVYAYAGYPLLLWARARRLPQRGAWPDPPEWPRVSISLPAYNEERQIAGALDAVLALDYPRDRLQVLVISDASTDATDRIVQGYAERGVELLRMPRRGGKTVAEQAGAAHLRGEIVVNTDASIRLHRDALKALVRPFADPSVGVASGRDVSVGPGESGQNHGEAGYVGYEMRVRALETRLGGIVGASGCLYAIRAELQRHRIPEELSRDFAAALVARVHGYGSVSVDDALCYVPRASSLRREYARKVRTISRGMDTLLHLRGLMDPRRHGGFAWRLVSHKVCRWAVPPAAVAAVPALAVAAPAHPWAWALLAGAALLMLAGAAGWAWPEGRTMPRPLALAAFAVLGNVAVLHALVRLARGVPDHVWEPTRRAPAAPHPTIPIP